MAAGLLWQVQHLGASPPSEGLLSQPEAPPGSVTGKRCCPSKENKVNVQMSLSNKTRGCLDVLHCWMWELVGVWDAAPGDSWGAPHTDPEF